MDTAEQDGNPSGSRCHNEWLLYYGINYLSPSIKTRNLLLPAGKQESGPGLMANSNVCVRKYCNKRGSGGLPGWYMHFHCPQGDALVCPTQPQRGSIPMLQLTAVASGQCGGRTQQYYKVFKTFLACLFPWQSQVSDPRALLFVSVLTNPPASTRTSKFGGSQITSLALPRGTRLAKSRHVSSVIRGHGVYLTGDSLAGKERGKAGPFCLREDILSIHFIPLSSEGRRGKGERNKAGN